MPHVLGADNVIDNQMLRVHTLKGCYDLGGGRKSMKILEAFMHLGGRFPHPHYFSSVGPVD